MSTEPIEVTAEDVPQANGVVVLKTKVDGVINTEIQIVGEIEPTEVQTLLELGVRAWRQRIGLSN